MCMDATSFPLEALKQTRADGSEFWSARDLMPLLGYTEWRNFHQAITRTLKVLGTHGIVSTEHARESSKLVEIGKGARREILDYEVSLFFLTVLVMSCGGDTTTHLGAARVMLAAQVVGVPHVTRSGTPMDGNFVRGHLYVVGDNTGRVKVGRSSNPESRVRKHCRTLKENGAVVTRVFVSDEFYDSRRAELEALRECESVGAPLGGSKEWFTSVPFDVAVAAVRKAVARFGA